MVVAFLPAGFEFQLVVTHLFGRELFVFQSPTWFLPSFLSVSLSCFVVTHLFGIKLFVSQRHIWFLPSWYHRDISGSCISACISVISQVVQYAVFPGLLIYFRSQIKYFWNAWIQPKLFFVININNFQGGATSKKLLSTTNDQRMSVLRYFSQVSPKAIHMFP